MCLECGVSIFMDSGRITIEGPTDAGHHMLKDAFCTECGGLMVLIGKAGDEPHYRLQQ
jgi:hypothetical protein